MFLFQNPQNILKRIMLFLLCLLLAKFVVNASQHNFTNVTRPTTSSPVDKPSTDVPIWLVVILGVVGTIVLLLLLYALMFVGMKIAKYRLKKKSKSQEHVASRDLKVIFEIRVSEIRM